MAARYSANKKLEGYVVSFDDVTDLVSAQRMAAWGDVARRIAHEIKNPLTPIQLSAERIKRKFASKIGEEGGELQQYAEVIIRQTDDLRRIVDEFSKFARMPEPDRRPIDLVQLLRSNIMLMANNANGVPVTLSTSASTLTYRIDDTMFNQAITNLIKNALEAIETKEQYEPNIQFAPKIKVDLVQTDDHIIIRVQDNGIGLPKERRSRLFEPYFTSRETGTGLGLSIVKKIIEQHDGTLELLDAPAFEDGAHIGAMAQIQLPFNYNENTKTKKA